MSPIHSTVNRIIFFPVTYTFKTFQCSNVLILLLNRQKKNCSESLAGELTALLPSYSAPCSGQLNHLELGGRVRGGEGAVEGVWSVFVWAGEGKGIFCFCRKDNCLECMLYVYRRLGKLLGKLPGKYSSHQTVGQWAVTELYSKQGFGARAVRSRGISSEPSFWPGSSLNFSFIILANCMVQKCAKKL